MSGVVFYRVKMQAPTLVYLFIISTHTSHTIQLHSLQTKRKRLFCRRKTLFKTLILWKSVVRFNLYSCITIRFTVRILQYCQIVYHSPRFNLQNLCDILYMYICINICGYGWLSVLAGGRCRLATGWHRFVYEKSGVTAFWKTCEVQMGDYSHVWSVSSCDWAAPACLKIRVITRAIYYLVSIHYVIIINIF